MSYRGYTIHSQFAPETDRNISVVSFRGSILSEDMAHFKRDLEVISSSCQYVAADFSQVSYISSSSFAVVADIFIAGRKEEGAFCLCCLQVDPLRVCKIIGLGSVIPVFQTMEEAVVFLRRVAHGEELAQSTLSRNIDRSLLSEDFELRHGLEHLHTIVVADEGSALAIVVRGRFEGGKEQIVCAPEFAAVEALLAKRQYELLFIEKTHPQFSAINQFVLEHPHQPALSVVSFNESMAQDLPKHLIDLARDRFADCRILEDLSYDQLQQIVSPQHIFHRQAQMVLHSDESSRHIALSVCRRLSLICGLDGERADNFFFAIREAVDNACKHGNAEDPSKRVSLEFVNTGDAVEMTVCDEGDGFDFSVWLEKSHHMNPLLQAREQSMKGETGGLGIMLIDRCCDRLVYHPPGNSLTITENIG